MPHPMSPVVLDGATLTCGALAAVARRGGLRALPQVHGPAVDAVRQVGRVLRTELNAAAEQVINAWAELGGNA